MTYLEYPQDEETLLLKQAIAQMAGMPTYI